MPEPAPPSRKGRSIPSFSEGVSSPKGQASEDGKICAPCVIRGVRAAKRGPSWQDLRAVRSRKAICGAFRMHGAHILPKPAHFGCMARESCRELAIFQSEATFRMHEAQNLPRIAARERISRVYCHCQSGQERIRAQSCHRRAPGERILRAFCHRRAPGERIFATSCAWRRHIVAMAGNRTEGRGTLSRTWRGALNAGIRAEGADDKLAHALRPSRLAPFAQADLPPSTNRP